MRFFICFLLWCSTVFSYEPFEKKEYCVVVDGYSTGKYYPTYFHKEGYPCIHIETGRVKFLQGFRPDGYEIYLKNPETSESLVEMLKTYPIACVVPGSESGIELAEDLSLALGLPSNIPGAAKKCRDKFVSGETLRRSNIPCVLQARIGSVAEALEWSISWDQWPLVVKPVDSSGADGFHFCRNKEEVEKAVNEVLGKMNFFGDVNRKILIQEYLEGDEFIVNTVSLDSQHFIQSFMVYEKKETEEGGLIFETYSLLKPSEHSNSEEIFAYARSVLDALGIKMGPAHLEIILTKKGPILVECNGRPHGHSFPDALMYECLGQTQIELATLAYVNPNSFLEKMKSPYHVDKYMTAVHLISHSEGRVREIQYLDEIQSLPSFYLYRIHPKPGDFIHKTRDLHSSPGDVFLKSESRMQIRDDIKKIREIEERNIFLLEADS